MAVNAYLVIDGITGPSTSRPNAIDVLSFKIGSSLKAVIGAGASGGETRSGRADVGNLSIMKVLDKTTPLLFEAITTGKVFKTATLTYGKSMGSGGQSDYFKIEMEEVVVSNLSHAGSSENPTEALTLAFSKAKFCYNPEDKQGNLAGWVEKGYDLQTLQAF